MGACGMTARSASAVAALIAANVGITSLSLTGNKDVAADGWTAIAHSLEHNTQINVLELHHNALEDAAACLIADALGRNTSVHTVDLEGNHIGDEAAERLQTALDVNATLRTIHLRNGNAISESLLADIERRTADRRRQSSASAS